MVKYMRFFLNSLTYRHGILSCLLVDFSHTSFRCSFARFTISYSRWTVPIWPFLTLAPDYILLVTWRSRDRRAWRSHTCLKRSCKSNLPKRFFFFQNSVSVLTYREAPYRIFVNVSYELDMSTPIRCRNLNIRETF